MLTQKFDLSFIKGCQVQTSVMTLIALLIVVQNNVFDRVLLIYSCFLTVLLIITTFALFYQVLECSWADLQTKLEEAKDLDEIITAHHAFLQSLMKRCLLDQSSRLVSICFVLVLVCSKISLTCKLRIYSLFIDYLKKTTINLILDTSKCCSKITLIYL